MKIKLKILIMFAASLIIFGGASKSFAQMVPIAGGYADVSVSDKEVVAAAKFAVKKHGKTQKAVINLISVKKARAQVVAGMNYEVCIEVSIKRAGKKSVRQFAKAIVYKNLKNIYSLTSWTILDDLSQC